MAGFLVGVDIGGTFTDCLALIQRKGAKVGLITTRGHEDAIHIMRGSRGVTSRDIRKVATRRSSMVRIWSWAIASEGGCVRQF